MSENIYNNEERGELLKFIRATISAKLNDETPPQLPAQDGKLDRQGSCFVTLHAESGALRGCIGNIAAYEPLGDNIAHNAVNSALNDPRFPSLTAGELESVVIEISILTPMHTIDSIDDFEIGKHGIVLICNGRSSVFLPQVAPEQGWDKATTLAHLSLKAGLPQNAWQSEDAKFQVFEAIVFSEKDQE
ncbi:MAG: AmmeMemoRadiSam system protein A [Victivallaceae bacterium]|nr:AmmeMemoRadiSam system protein A [Victivallaceae bacterium]